MQELFQETELKMKHAVDHLHEELKHLRTGRASLAMLDHVNVSYYGTPTPIAQVANLSVPDPTLIVAQPYDPSVIGELEKAIRSADLGLNPSNDGKVARNAIRQARREGNDELKRMEKDKEIGQDDEHRGMDEVQKLHDHYIGETNKTLENKEKDILTV